jgi:peroxiredoxin
VLLERLDLTPTEFAERTGWKLEPEGACKDDVCVPLPSLAPDADGRIDVTVVAESLGMPIAHDEAHGLWALGPRSGDRRVLDDARMPDLVLHDFDGNVFDLAAERGRKVVLAAWSSWCGCRFDLPGWQALHEELSPLGVEIVTVALDTDTEAARPWHDASNATHPSLVDPEHHLVASFGVTNVPFALWIDEEGTIVRPAEVAFAPAPRDPTGGYEEQASIVEQLPERLRKVVAAISPSRDDTDRYPDALRDWARNGSTSRYALPAEEVVERSRPRPAEFGLAAAHFELGQHLHRAGFPRDAVAHFQEAHRLDPTNWSYQREALSLADPDWGPVYERDLLQEVELVGTETFYPPLDL